MIRTLDLGGDSSQRASDGALPAHRTALAKCAATCSRRNLAGGGSSAGGAFFVRAGHAGALRSQPDSGARPPRVVLAERPSRPASPTRKTRRFCRWLWFTCWKRSSAPWLTSLRSSFWKNWLKWERFSARLKCLTRQRCASCCAPGCRAVLMLLEERLTAPAVAAPVPAADGKSASSVLPQRSSRMTPPQAMASVVAVVLKQPAACSVQQAEEILLESMKAAGGGPVSQ